MMPARLTNQGQGSPGQARLGQARETHTYTHTHTHTQKLLWPQSMGTTILPNYGTAKKTVLTPHDTDTHHTLFQFPLPAELSRRLGLVVVVLRRV